eukprot:10730666-Lingulodinium_polyedra.AAC.1
MVGHQVAQEDSPSMDAKLNPQPRAGLCDQRYHGRQRVGAREHRHRIPPVVRSPDGRGSGVRAVGRVPQTG